MSSRDRSLRVTAVNGSHPGASWAPPSPCALRRDDLLDSIRYASITALAEALDADRPYVRRLLILATLAPALVAALVAGREPSGVTLERVTKGMPVLWAQAPFPQHSVTRLPEPG